MHSETGARPVKRRRIRRTKDKKQIVRSSSRIPCPLYAPVFFTPSFSRANRQQWRAESVDFIRHDYVTYTPVQDTHKRRTVKSWGRRGGEEKGGASRKRVISHLWICELPTDHEDGIVLSCFSIERKISRILLIENYRWSKIGAGKIWNSLG